jgi:GNAT superfamily N-acetyltransferase
VPLAIAYGCAAFNSDSEPLNRYLREQVIQDVRRGVAAYFVALAKGERIAGYYTLASASLLLSDLPTWTGKKLPRYPTVAAVRVGRLAVDPTFKGQGLGSALLADALDRAAWAKFAVFALMVDTNDEAAAPSTAITASLLCRMRRLPCFCRWQLSSLLECCLARLASASENFSARFVPWRDAVPGPRDWVRPSAAIRP